MLEKEISELTVKDVALLTMYFSIATIIILSIVITISEWIKRK